MHTRDLTDRTQSPHIESEAAAFIITYMAISSMKVEDTVFMVNTTRARTLQAININYVSLHVE